MNNSALVVHTRISPHKTSPRKNTIKKITIHHMASNLSIETCGNVFANPKTKASANYGIDSDGRIGLYVEECDRSWASKSPANDHQAVTIEVANCSIGGDWPVSDAAYAALIDLCVDICLRNGIPSLTWTGDSSGTLTCHYMFANTACPGPYLKSKMAEIAAAVNERLGSGSGGTVESTPAATTSTATSSSGTSIAELKKAGILKFQPWLNSFGGYGLVVDGIKGPKTMTAATKAMQTTIGTTADGIWGTKSIAACITLKQGSTGNAVYIVQGLLYCKGSVYSGFDGIYGEKTVAEIKAYQKANGLTVDGIAGPKTITSLLAA